MRAQTHSGSTQMAERPGYHEHLSKTRQFPLV